MSEEKSTHVITGLVRMSYLAVFQPKSIDSGDLKYSASLLIPKSDKVTLKKIENAIKAALEASKEKFKIKDITKLPSNFKMPLRDGDSDRPDDEAYAGMMFVNATGNRQPGILDKHKNKITDEDDFYSGCYGRASVNFYAYDVKGNRGIACGLNNLQKIKDGERLDGSKSAENDFDDDYADQFEDDFDYNQGSGDDENFDEDSLY